MSGLKGPFIKRYTVERTNKTGIRPEEQSEKTESLDLFSFITLINELIKCDNDKLNVCS